MINDISSSLFHDFSITGSGAVFNIKESDTVIRSCAFRYCTASVYGACFLLTNSNTNITKTCFFHSHVTTKVNSYFGNAFFIDQSTQLTHFEYLSAYRCGFDASSVGDSTFVTHAISLIANDMNFSNCASYEGSALCVEGNQMTQLSYLTCINIYGEIAYGKVASCSCSIDSFNFISSPTLLYTFWLADNLVVSISNGIFNNVFKTSFSFYNKKSFILNNCYCDQEIPYLPDMKVLKSSSTLQFPTIITAEICEKRELQYIMKTVDYYYCKKQSMFSCILILILMI